MALVAMTSPSRSRVSVSSPKRTVKSYCLVASSIRPASFVASPSAIGRTRLASGSSVPPCPTLVLGSPASRRIRLTALTAVVEPRPTGLSRMIQPWSMGAGLHRPLVLQNREQHGVADVAGPGDAVGAHHALSHRAQLLHRR